MPAKPAVIAATSDDQPAVVDGSGNVSSDCEGSVPAGVSAPHTTMVARPATATQTPRATISEGRSSPIRARSHRAPSTMTATGPASSSAGNRPKRPLIAMTSLSPANE